MANLAPPKKKVDKFKEQITTTVAKAAPKTPIEQSPPSSIVPLQLKVQESSKKEFKAYAAMRGQSMSSLFLEMFTEYKNKHD